MVSSDHVSIGAYDNVLIIIWSQMPTMEDFGLVESATTDLIERNASGIGLLIVIAENNHKPPPPAVLRRNADLVARHGDQIWGMARVIEGDGLKTGVVRFVLSTMDLLSNSSIPEKTVEDVTEAVAWLHSVQPRVHQRSVLNEVDRIRRAGASLRSEERPAARSR